MENIQIRDYILILLDNFFSLLLVSHFLFYLFIESLLEVFPFRYAESNPFPKRFCVLHTS